MLRNVEHERWNTYSSVFEQLHKNALHRLSFNSRACMILKNDGYLNECSKNKLCNKYVTVLNDSDLSLNDVIKVYFNFIL